MKTLDFNKSVFELCKEYPEIKEVMRHLGFTEITKPGKLATVGRFMTIPKGALMMKLNLEEICLTFEEKGYIIINSGI